MTTILYNVARAIREGQQCGTMDAPLHVPCSFCHWSPVDGDGSETGCVWLARAAILAMRDPTPDITKAGEGAMASDGAHDCEVRVGEIWQTMIDEALK